MENRDPLGLTLTDPLFDEHQKQIEEAGIDLITGSLDIFSVAMGLPPLPIFTTFFKSLYKGAVSFKEVRELEMLVISLAQLKKLSRKQKKAIAAKLDKKGPEFTRKVVYSISQLNSIEKSRIYGNILRALVEEKIDFEDFEETVFTVERSLVQDLNLIYQLGKKALENSENSIANGASLKDTSWLLAQVTQKINYQEFISNLEICRMVSENLIIEVNETVPLGRLITNRPRNEDVMELRKHITNTHKFRHFSRAAMCIFLYGFR